jgi:hypothetical protein
VAHLLENVTYVIEGEFEEWVAIVFHILRRVALV